MAETEPCPVCGKPIRHTANGVSMRSHMKTHDGEDLPAAAGEPPTSPFEDSSPPSEETPSTPNRTIRERLLGRTKQIADPAAARPKETRPSRPRPKRVDASGFIGDTLGWVGRKIEEHYSLPTGRAVMIEAEPAGMILAEAVKDTTLDRPVQWCARNYTAASEAFSVLRFPVAVEMGARQIMTTGQLSPVVRREIIDSLISMAPYFAKVAKRQIKAERDLAEAMEAFRDIFGVPQGQSVTEDHLLSFLYPTPDQPIPANVTNVA